MIDKPAKPNGDPNCEHMFSFGCTPGVIWCCICGYRPESNKAALRKALDNITDENRHDEVNTGPSVGKEII